MPPKRGAAAEFYNHDIRPAKSRQIAVNVSSTNNNRRNLNVFSRFYPTVPAEEPAAPDADSYDPAPVDAYQAMLDAQTTEESAAYSEKQSTGIPGIAVVAKTRKRYENSDVPLKTWITYRSEYLDEIMILEGRGRFGSLCPQCRTPCPIYRCNDCMCGALWCERCLVDNHSQMPLHNIQKWNGSFFERTTLAKLGLRVNLGHAPGLLCQLRRKHDNFTVIDLNGIHQVNINFCQCNSIPEYRQLLQVGWYPATPLQPHTCATLQVLRHAHFLNLQGKLPGYGFYKALEYQTDNTGLEKIPDRLSAWMLMVREYRNLEMLKHAGVPLQEKPFAQMAPGSLAIPCRACPIPNVNLPADWQDAPPERAWLYTLWLAMDANFRLRSKIRGINVDPSLCPGWAYFVENAPYAECMAKAADDVDISTCVGFQAILNMLTKKSKGLRATGMAAVSCARHQLFRPLGMGDLQKGERQVNMDYLLTSAIRAVKLLRLGISYDVVCLWIKRFGKRLKYLPSAIQPSIAVEDIIPLVPKFHLQAHKEDCHSRYSFNFCPGAGRTDGEGVERNWDGLNGQAPSTCEMLPHHRWETLDDCAGWMNWRKTMGLGNLLLKRLLIAIHQTICTHTEFKAYDASLRKEYPAEIALAEKELAAWIEETHGKKPCDCIAAKYSEDADPFRMPRSNKTLDSVRLKMAEEDKKRADTGDGVMPDVSASAFLLLGIEIQVLQQHLRAEVKGERKQTLLQTTSLVERRTTLIKRFQRFREVQRVHMPGFDPLTRETEATEIENTKLYLPSDLKDKHEWRKYCPNGLVALEDRIRFAEACDALEDLRHWLRTRSFTNQFKVAFVTGQIKNTRAREVQHRIDDRVRAAETRYNRARAALKKLRGGGEWELKLKVLEQSDVRALNERELTRQEEDEERARRIKLGLPVDDISSTRRVRKTADVGDGARRPSWIWCTGVKPEGIDDPMTRKAIRVEWARTKHRADRWWEEVVMVDEEMRRTLVTCSYMEDWWEQLKGKRSGARKLLREGLDVYACRHVALEAKIREAWTDKWALVRERARPIVDGNIPDKHEESAYTGEVQTLELDVQDDGADDNYSDADRYAMYS